MTWSHDMAIIFGSVDVLCDRSNELRRWAVIFGGTGYYIVSNFDFWLLNFERFPDNVHVIWREKRNADLISKQLEPMPPESEILKLIQKKWHAAKEWLEDWRVKIFRSTFSCWSFFVRSWGREISPKSYTGKRSPIYAPFLTEKVTLSYTFHENGKWYRKRLYLVSK